MQYTYTTLLASCQNYFIDNSVEFTNEYPNLVQLSEMRIIKDMNLGIFDIVTTGTMTAGTPDISKPSDLIVVQDLFVFVSSSKVYLQQRSKSYLDSYWPNASLTAQPIYYSDDTTTTWQLAPTPDSNYSYQVNYVARPTPMSATNPTTYIGNMMGEVLLYATLVEAACFFREDPATSNGMITLWEKSYEEAMALAKAELEPMISGKDNLVFPSSTMAPQQTS